MLLKYVAVVLLMVCGACNSTPIIKVVSPLSPVASPTLAATIIPTPWPTSTATPLPTVIPTPVGIAPPPGLIYKTNDGLWRVEADGKPVRLLSLDAEHKSFVLSPEGDRALYWDWNEGDIGLGDLRTGEVRNLTNTPARFECCPLWWVGYPDRVLFASQGRSDRPWGPTLLVTKNLSDGELQIIDQSGAFIGPAASSPDGDSIAYSRSGQPMLYQSDTGIESFNLADFGVAMTATRAVGGPAWSPDGKYIAWTTSSFYSNTQQIATGVLNLVQQNWRLFHPYEPIGRDSFGFPNLLWSPDSKWLVMPVDTRNSVSGREEVSQQVIRIGAENGEEHAVDPGPLVWGPDSKYLVLNHMLIEAETWDANPIALPRDAEVVAWINPVPQ